MKLLSLFTLVLLFSTGAFADQSFDLKVTSKGFEPSDISIVKGQPVTLNITRETDSTCAKSITIPDYDIEKELPLGQSVAIRFTPKKSGKISYGCDMNHMVGGHLLIN